MLIKINKDPTREELRQFAWLLLFFFSLLGGLSLWKHKVFAAYIWWGVGFLLSAISLTSNHGAKFIYKAWMRWAWIMGSVISYVVLGIFYFLIITPVGWFFRLLGRDVLCRTRLPATETYWKDLPKIVDPSYYDHLF